MRRALYLLIAASLFVVVGKLGFDGYHKWQQKAAPININGTILKKPLNLPSFNLKTNNETNFDDTKLQNQWSLIFFGYTACPDICPTTLSTLNKMYSLLEDMPKQQKPTIIFVSIDSEKDQDNQANKYARYFNNNFIGLTGNKSQLENITKILGVVYQKVNVGNNQEASYVFDHSSTIYVVNPRAQIQAVLSSPHKAEELAKDYKALITKFG